MILLIIGGWLILMGLLGAADEASAASWRREQEISRLRFMAESSRSER